MLEEFGSNLWVSDGPNVTAAAGFHYPTRMAIIRLPGNELVLWSPVALTDELRAAVAELGKVRCLVAPNSLHDTFLADWHRAYPEALIFAAPGLRGKRPDLRVEGELGEVLPPGWDGEIDTVLVRGNRITTEAVLFHRGSQTVIFADLLQQFPKGWFRGWRSVIARLDLMMEPAPSVPRKFRLAFTDRSAARESIQHILAWPAKRVLVAHGSPVTQNGQAFLKRAFRWLLKP